MHCGTSYATPMVTGVVGAMLSINPALEPEQLRELLRRSALTIGRNSDFDRPTSFPLSWSHKWGQITIAFFTEVHLVDKEGLRVPVWLINCRQQV